MYGPVQGKEEWRIWYNQEVYHLYESSDIITMIKAAKLQWAGHLQRIGCNETSRRIMDFEYE